MRGRMLSVMPGRARIRMHGWSGSPLTFLLLPTLKGPAWCLTCKPGIRAAMSLPYFRVYRMRATRWYHIGVGTMSQSHARASFYFWPPYPLVLPFQGVPDAYFWHGRRNRLHFLDSLGAQLQAGITEMSGQSLSRVHGCFLFSDLLIPSLLAILI